ncbi:MAG TPA: dienelactone hydrolase family protein [Steroidobacteraceae bacterium]|nr:dienelactone hydrolase family protein [Steroidobacteraceae bacterium]
MSEPPVSRRDFTALSIAAGITAATGARAAAGAHEALDRDVQVSTPSGTCDAALVHPRGDGRWPAAILFVDAFGLRPVMRDMAKRLARDGYVVLVPNPYYRSTKAPGLPAGFDFGNPADRQKLAELRAPLTADAVAQDAIAYTAFLDAHAPIKKSAKMGVFGYCMGGPMTLRAAAALPERIGAGASFHGGGLVSDKSDSPHLLVPRMKAKYYIAIAANDDASDPQAKTKLRQAFDDAHLPAKIEVYDGCMHGWCVKDMPHAPDGKPIYNEAQAERAWNDLVVLFKGAVV